jgi:hypothetical protein
MPIPLLDYSQRSRMGAEVVTRTDFIGSVIAQLRREKPESGKEEVVRYLQLVKVDSSLLKNRSPRVTR